MVKNYEGVEWDEGNRDHAAGHGISDLEIEQVIENSDRRRRHPNIPGRWFIEGRTDGGRKVLVVVDFEDRRLLVRPITAWEVK